MLSRVPKIHPDLSWVPIRALLRSMGTRPGAAAPLGEFQGAGESPLPLAPAEVTVAGPCGTGTPCRAWSKGYAGREGHSPEESPGEPSVTSGRDGHTSGLDYREGRSKGPGKGQQEPGPAGKGELPQILAHNFFCFSQCPGEPVLGSWNWKHMPFPVEQLKQPEISHRTHCYPKGT